MKKLLLLVPAFLCGMMLFAQSGRVNVGAYKKIGIRGIGTGDGMLKTNDLVQNIALTKDLSVLYHYITATNLTLTYKSKGPITLFAPVNEAFDALPVGKKDSLNKPAQVWELTAIIANHAVAGSLTAKDIEKQINGHKGLATFTTIAGGKLHAKIDNNGNIVLIDENGGEGTLSRVDIKQNNGILHVIDHVLMPKKRIV